jgi:hypothetical protein
MTMMSVSTTMSATTMSAAMWSAANRIMWHMCTIVGHMTQAVNMVYVQTIKMMYVQAINVQRIAMSVERIMRMQIMSMMPSAVPIR